MTDVDARVPGVGGQPLGTFQSRPELVWPERFQGMGDEGLDDVLGAAVR